MSRIIDAAAGLIAEPTARAAPTAKSRMARNNLCMDAGLVIWVGLLSLESANCSIIMAGMWHQHHLSAITLSLRIAAASAAANGDSKEGI
ncbi:MAG: hypothetical protein VXW40_02535 [Pseudomonadota bacterium]|nr:hypothetical protein [Pseudomonadota bacterium]